MTAYLMGLDISTTGSKALLINPSGEVIASATSEHPMYSPRALWAEQNPEDWWRSVVESIRTALSESGINAADISGIGLTGQMHGLVLLDGGGHVLRPCIMWNDQRTGEECAEITTVVGESKLIEITGKPVLPNFTAPKIAWVRKQEPQVYDKAAHVLLPKDFVRYRLTGELFSDVSDASGTSLFDVGRRNWSEELIGALGIQRSWLPEVTESPEISAKISAEAARLTGLIEGTPVVGGAGDQAAQAIGTGIIDEGIVSATLGTSGVLFTTTNDYCTDREGKIHSYCHASPGKWHLMGVMLSAAGSLRWFRDALGDSEIRLARETGKDPYEIISDEASAISAGCEGLIFLPYLTGERTPHADANARGVFFGLTLRHGKAHMARAVLEGVSFGLRDSLELMRALGLPIGEFRASGGGAKSRLWRQILADNFETDLLTVNISEGAAYGAALLAGVGAGIYRSVEDACATTIRITGRTSPGSAVRIYSEYYRRYRALYPALKREFEELARLAERFSQPDAEAE